MMSLLDSDYSEDEIKSIIECSLFDYGKVTNCKGGMCGSVYFFDQGLNVFPRLIVAKLPRIPQDDRIERNRRFLRELEIQHPTYGHKFVCAPFDYKMVLDTPVALYRAADDDLAEWIPRLDFSITSRLAVLIYLCEAVRYCRSKGVECHQDLKPQNILMQDMNARFSGFPENDVFTFPLLADFGLANMGLEFGNAEGARPYMAPEQWLYNRATTESDIFALGVIIFEVMTQGHHPIGGLIREWWPIPEEGNSKKWLRPKMWEKWAKKGAPVAPATFLINGIDTISKKCLAPIPSDRPTIEELQTSLLQILDEYDNNAAVQVKSQICLAKSSDSFPYRDSQLASLRLMIAKLQ